MTMIRHLIPLFCLLGLLTRAAGFDVTTTEGQVYNASGIRRDVAKIYFKIPGSGGGGTIEMGLPIVRIAKVAFPEPPELALARAAADKGNADKVLELTGPFVASEGQYKDVPGSWWPQMAKLRILALACSGKDLETADLSREMGAIRTPEATSIARGGTLFSALKSGDTQAVIVGAKALPLFGGDAGSPLAQLALGRALLAKKDYAGAIRAFLAIKVFYPSVSLLQPPAIYGSVACYTGLQDKRRFAARSELAEWPDSPQGIEMAKAKAKALAAKAASGSPTPTTQKSPAPNPAP